jgi:hypothetical protein
LPAISHHRIEIGGLKPALPRVDFERRRFPRLNLPGGMVLRAFPEIAMSADKQLADIGNDGFVSAEDVLFLRKNVFRDGVVSAGEIDALFALARRAPQGDPQWPMFFEEAAADFFLREEEPQGYLTEEEFAALKTRVGETPDAFMLSMLVKLCEKATKTPPAMTDFIAAVLKRQILERATKRVAKDDATLIARFIYAAGGDGNVAVTRKEAELLFDVNDATRGAANDPAWGELFVKGVAAHLMSHFTYDAQDRATAMKRQAFASDQSVKVGSFFKRMISGGLAPLEQRSAQALRNAGRDGDIAEAEKVTLVESEWLAERIGRDGSFLPSERLLLNRMREYGADLPPKLKALVNRAA